MPHVQRSVQIPVDTDVHALEAALRNDLRLHPHPPAADAGADDRTRGQRSWSGPIDGMPDTESRLVVHYAPDADGRVHEVELTATSTVVVPFFTWFLRIQGILGARRALPHAAEKLHAALEDRAGPPPLSPWALVPPVPFTPEQAGRLCALAVVALLANFAGSLLSQNGDAVTSAFGRSDQALGAALAIARAGVLVSLVAIALADRLGRRKLILAALVGACAFNLVAAVSPTFEIFTGSQVVTRALVNTALVVAGIAAVEEAPEGARAFATGMFALALGAGFGLAVILLPPISAPTAGASPSGSARRSCSSSRWSPATCARPGATNRSPTARRTAGGCARCSTVGTGRAFSCSASPRSSPTCSAHRRRSSPTAT